VGNTNYPVVGNMITLDSIYENDLKRYREAVNTATEYLTREFQAFREFKVKKAKVRWPHYCFMVVGIALAQFLVIKYISIIKEINQLPLIWILLVVFPVALISYNLVERIKKRN
jgi:hypothetical protein